jgi:hypothetical protein
MLFGIRLCAKTVSLVHTLRSRVLPWQVFVLHVPPIQIRQLQVRCLPRAFATPVRQDPTGARARSVGLGNTNLSTEPLHAYLVLPGNTQVQPEVCCAQAVSLVNTLRSRVLPWQVFVLHVPPIQIRRFPTRRLLPALMRQSG